MNLVPIPLLFSEAVPSSGLGGIVLVAGLGMAAVFLLLPRVRSFPSLWGGALGGLALLLAGGLVVQAEVITAEVLLFYAFSAIALVAGTLLVTQANPVHAALSFALVVLSTCGLFLLLAAPFLMAATTIIYAGAIIVTFLFVIMLAQQAGLSDADHRSREPLLCTIAGFVLLGALLHVLKLSYDTREIDELGRRTADVVGLLEPSVQTSAPNLDAALQKQVDQLLEDYQNEARRWRGMGEGIDLKQEAENACFEREPAKVKESLQRLVDISKRIRARPNFLQSGENLPLSGFSGPRANLPESQQRVGADGRAPLPAENVAYLGRSLFTDNLLAVELGGTLLLVATIGAIVITGRRGERL